MYNYKFPNSNNKKKIKKKPVGGKKKKPVKLIKINILVQLIPQNIIIPTHYQYKK